jgi:ABC-type glutathione transport system ATPase component
VSAINGRYLVCSRSYEFPAVAAKRKKSIGGDNMGQVGVLQNGETLLKLEDVHMYFGRVAALAGVDLEVKKGEIHSIIGPNGAGKTVMMNCINGLYKPQRGRITYKEQGHHRHEAP